VADFLKGVTLVDRQEEDGTGIGDGLALGLARLKTAEEALARQTDQVQEDFEIKSKIIILLTDGQNNTGRYTPVEAAAMAKSWGIKIYTIGVGGEESSASLGGFFQGFFTPQGTLSQGQGVDKETLQAVAKATGGIFYMAEDEKSLRAIYREIDLLEKSEIESVRYFNYRERFPPLVFLALGLLGLEILLTATLLRKIP
jgi:Ca-activated chloride channel family protein